MHVGGHTRHALQQRSQCDQRSQHDEKHVKNVFRFLFIPRFLHVSHHAVITDRTATAAAMHDVCGLPRARAWPHTTWVVQASIGYQSSPVTLMRGGSGHCSRTDGLLFGAAVITVNSDYTRRVERLMVNSHGVGAAEG